MTMPLTQAPLTTGDPMPDIPLPNQAGGLVSLYQQKVAGDPVVLLLCAAANDPTSLGQLQRLSALASDFQSTGAHIFAVTTDSPVANDSLVRAHGLDFEVLSDPAGFLFRSFAMAPASPSRTVVLGPDLRVGRVIDGLSQPDEALEHCKTAYPTAAEPEVVTAHAPVLCIDDVFPPEFCDDLIGVWERGDKRADVVGRRGQAVVGTTTKKRTDHHILDPDVIQRVSFYIGRRVLPEMAKAFQFRVLRTETLRVGCYDAVDGGGYFRRHRDTGKPNTEHRRYAMSLNLNTGDYEGGYIRFPEYGPLLYEPRRGGAVVFSCSLLHEALPVTAGRRFALFTFFSGEQMPEGWPWQSLGSLTGRPGAPGIQVHGAGN